MPSRTWTEQGRGLRISELAIPPKHDNDNWLLFAEWKTVAEFLQWLRRTREEMRQELIADFSLRNDPTHRRHWETLDAMERCAKWLHLGIREG